MENARLRLALAVLFACMAGQAFSATQMIQIGTENNDGVSLPIVANFDYSYSQQIYTQAEINSAGRTSPGYIQSIAFYHAENQNTFTGNSTLWDVYFTETTKSSFSGRYDWVTEGYVLVFSGRIPTTLGWVTINLPTPYYWDGTKDLVITVDENAANRNGTAYWAVVSTSPQSRALSYNVNSSTNPTPFNPNIQATNILSVRSSIRITFSDEPQVPVELSYFTAAINYENYITLTWVSQSETGMAGYYVYRSRDGDLEHAEVISPLIQATNSSDLQIYNYTDEEIYEDGDYYYWLQSAELDGYVYFHGPVKAHYNSQGGYDPPEIPLNTELKTPYPNPFNPFVHIPFSLVGAQEVDIRIYNVRGQLQRTFNLGVKEQGNHQIFWDGTNRNGDLVASGVYRILMTVGTKSYTRNAVLLK